MPRGPVNRWESVVLADWHWLPTQNAKLSEDDRVVTFHPLCSQGTEVVRSSKGWSQGIHYWEVKLLSPAYGSDMIVGVGLEEFDPSRYASDYCSALGIDELSWGLNYSGHLLHAGLSIKPFVPQLLSVFGRGTVLGCLLDLWHKTLHFFIDGKTHTKIGFKNLPNGTFYPMLCSTASRTGFRLIRTESYDASLQLSCLIALSRIDEKSRFRIQIPDVLQASSSDDDDSNTSPDDYHDDQPTGSGNTTTLPIPLSSPSSSAMNRRLRSCSWRSQSQPPTSAASNDTNNNSADQPECVTSTVANSPPLVNQHSTTTRHRPRRSSRYTSSSSSSCSSSPIPFGVHRFLGTESSQQLAVGVSPSRRSCTISSITNTNQQRPSRRLTTSTSSSANQQQPSRLKRRQRQPHRYSTISSLGGGDRAFTAPFTGSRLSSNSFYHLGASSPPPGSSSPSPSPSYSSSIGGGGDSLDRRRASLLARHPHRFASLRLDDHDVDDHLTNRPEGRDASSVAALVLHHQVGSAGDEGRGIVGDLHYSPSQVSSLSGSSNGLDEFAPLPSRLNQHQHRQAVTTGSGSWMPSTSVSPSTTVASSTPSTNSRQGPSASGDSASFYSPLVESPSSLIGQRASPAPLNSGSGSGSGTTSLSRLQLARTSYAVNNDSSLVLLNTTGSSLSSNILEMGPHCAIHRLQAECSTTSHEILITEETVQLLLPAANLLQLPAIRDACCEFLQSQLHPSNCLGIQRFADLHDCPDLLAYSRRFTEQHFGELLEQDDGDEFLSLSPDQLSQLVSSDRLAVSEDLVFDAVLRWISHDPAKRQLEAPRLCSNVRFALLPRDYLVSLSQSDGFLASNPWCKDYLIEALSYHLLPWEQKLRIDSQRVKPRMPVGLPKILVVFGGQAPKAIRSVECYDLRSGLWYYSSSSSTIQSQEPTTTITRASAPPAIGNPVADANEPAVDPSSRIEGDPEVTIAARSPLIASLPTRRCRFGAAVVGRHVYLVGGFNGSLRVRSTEVYDSVANSWQSGPSMDSRRATLGVAVLDSVLYAVGGFDGINGLQTAEALDLRSDCWRYIAPMSCRRSSVGVGALNGKLYAVGGYDGRARECLASVEAYDPLTNKWNPVSEMTCSRSGPSVCELNNRLYVVGGHDGPSIRNTAEVYNPETLSWHRIANLNVGRRNAGLVAHDGCLYVVGGEQSDTYLASVEQYDPAVNAWTLLSTEMQIGRSYAGVAIVERLIATSC